MGAPRSMGWVFHIACQPAPHSRVATQGSRAMPGSTARPRCLLRPLTRKGWVGAGARARQANSHFPMSQGPPQAFPGDSLELGSAVTTGTEDKEARP